MFGLVGDRDRRQRRIAKVDRLAVRWGPGNGLVGERTKKEFKGLFEAEMQQYRDDKGRTETCGEYVIFTDDDASAKRHIEVVRFLR